ncbi:MAG TPA: hypothetical protein VF809_03685 [Candidatus Saccharimonadales bacterium]
MAFALFASWVTVDVLVFTPSAAAAQIVTRSLALSSSANGNITVGAAGSGTNGAQTKHTFTFTEGTTAATIGSAEFLYCTTPLPDTACTAPTGLDVTTVTTIGGTTATGWSLGTNTANRVRVTRTAGNITDTQNLVFGAGGTGTDYIKNPTTDNEEFFVRISTFSDTAYTTVVDRGTVANSTAEQIEITAKVQETLNLSVGTTATAAGTTCAALTGSALALGDGDGVLSFQQAYDAHSYFRISTNANVGTVVYYSGDTLKYGANDINAIGGTAAASAVGTEQFGLAIDDTGTQTSDQYTFNSLVASAQYTGGQGTITNGGTATFAFNTASVTTPVQVASTSGSTKTIVCDTGSVRYLGNIATTTVPGIYTSTLSYLATPTY